MISESKTSTHPASYQKDIRQVIGGIYSMADIAWQCVAIDHMIRGHWTALQIRIPLYYPPQLCSASMQGNPAAAPRHTEAASPYSTWCQQKTDNSYLLLTPCTRGKGGSCQKYTTEILGSYHHWFGFEKNILKPILKSRIGTPLHSVIGYLPVIISGTNLWMKLTLASPNVGDAHYACGYWRALPSDYPMAGH